MFEYRKSNRLHTPVNAAPPLTPRHDTTTRFLLPCAATTGGPEVTPQAKPLNKAGLPSSAASGINEINPMRLDPIEMPHSDIGEVKSCRRGKNSAAITVFGGGGHRRTGVLMSLWLQKGPRWATTWIKWTQVC